MCPWLTAALYNSVDLPRRRRASVQLKGKRHFLSYRAGRREKHTVWSSCVLHRRASYPLGSVLVFTSKASCCGGRYCYIYSQVHILLSFPHQPPVLYGSEPKVQTAACMPQSSCVWLPCFLLSSATGKYLQKMKCWKKEQSLGKLPASLSIRVSSRGYSWINLPSPWDWTAMVPVSTGPYFCWNLIRLPHPAQ